MAKQAKKKQQQHLNNLTAGVTTIGLDIGYGVVKVVTDENSFGFPSVMGHAREIKFQQETIQQKYPGDQITDDEGEWFVGDLAADVNGSDAVDVFDLLQYLDGWFAGGCD